ncbi:phage tail protein [Pseudomonas brassicacearum]|uniref:phage tail-collar fiber domain-containing protein n=1 Tax=Pseudomonas brassicacearum TaxID=930166 RepID=UPI0011F0D228|nr:phage tail protein [Pseudomonas brassicacearum]QEO80241.1 phage tail protein [Pseudomonas brassicacearum]
MVDKNTIFGGMLTTLGANKKTNCDALGIPWEPKFMLIGDANGTDPVPSPSQTRLINQVYRAQLNQLRVSEKDANVLIAELVLPPDVGGWWIRELALEDKDGVFCAVSNVAPSYKPLLEQNSGRNQVVRMHIITNGTSNIQLKIDPSVVLATREYVDTKIQEELFKLDNKQSVRAATTVNIALNGLQTIDGVSLLAGDRVLVKNQTSAKDNGIYVVGVGAWQRAPDADISSEVTSALILSVEQGTALADTRWQLVTDGSIVLGTTALTFQNVTQGFAPLNSPAFLGIPTAPTAAPALSNSQIATTAFVKAALNAVGLGEVVGSAYIADMNDVTLPSGVYYASGGSTLNLPPAAQVNGTVIHKIYGGGGLQIFQGYATEQLYWRRKTPEQWEPWNSLASLDSPAFIGNPTAPTPPQFDKDKSLATTEFVQREKGSFANSAGIAGGNVTLTAAHVGTRIEMSAGGTLTLPKASTLPKGSAILITTSSAVDAAKLALLAGDSLAINNVSVPTPYTMAVGSDILLVSDGAMWRAHASLECLRSSSLFAAIFGANGHQILPSGWTFKIGHASTDTATGTVPVTFPTAFPTACMFVGAMYAGASGAPNPSVCQCGQPTRTGFTGYITSVASNSSSVTVGGYNWLAIGY